MYARSRGAVNTARAELALQPLKETSGGFRVRPMLIVLDASFLASATHVDDLPPPMFAEIAFAGRSNVGKSSLINALLERKRLVRTSSKPGATRGINVFRIKVRTPRPRSPSPTSESNGAQGDKNTLEAELDLVDLPGYGYARRSKKERRSWGPLIESFLSKRPGLRTVVIIVDARRGLEADDRQLLEYLESIDRPALLVVTKLDKLPKNRQKLTVQAIGKQSGVRAFGFSAITGEGRDKLWRALLRAAHVGTSQ